MAKKHKHPEHENLERWLVSYADFMTLLFATFTALYALAQTDVSKLRDVSAAIREGFEEQSIMNGIKTILQGKSPPNDNPNPLSTEKGAGAGVIGKFESMTYKPGEIKSMKKLADQLSHDISEMNESLKKANQALNLGSGSGQNDMQAKEDASVPIRPITAAVQDRGLRISLDSRLLFAPGSSALRAEGLKYLDILADKLKQFDTHRLHVEGHTDSQPISTLLFPSNWELSGARASSVVRYFIDRHQFNPASLVALGYASTQPLATNDTAEGRSKNRRVDIVLYSEKLSSLLNPRAQAVSELPLSTKSNTPDGPKTIIPILPEASVQQNQDGPVKVIIKEKDGSERVLVPKTKAEAGLKSKDVAVTSLESQTKAMKVLPHQKKEAGQSSSALPGTENKEFKKTPVASAEQQERTPPIPKTHAGSISKTEEKAAH